ncbi:MAG TPA: YraN family protein [Pusillimonas sp.]|uniref:YraN family protein n=1 Tax=unclassified Pusillimonas TaxID=2640016 RepID=UPI00261790AD|nr:MULTISPECIES: YraN family protein [unclassified Pusillimonas]HLU18851.1 YraN family protein [Pusillimonas sp.]
MDDTSDPIVLARLAQHKAIHRRRRNASRKLKGHAVTDDLPRLSPSQRRGRTAEERAAAHVEASGAMLLGRNLSCRLGEIDLICQDGAVLVFIEVRQRHNSRFGGAAASVDTMKRQRLVRAARYFLPILTQRYFRGVTPRCRFDVIAIDSLNLDWIKSAFEAMR